MSDFFKGRPGVGGRRKVGGQPSEPLVTNVVDTLDLGQFECKSLSIGNFRAAIQRFSNLNALKEDKAGNYFGFLYLTGTRDGEIFDLPPLRFFWNKRTQQVAKVDLSDLGELNTNDSLVGITSLYNPELIGLLKQIARDNNISFQTFTFRTEEFSETEDVLSEDVDGDETIVDNGINDDQETLSNGGNTQDQAVGLQQTEEGVRSQDSEEPHESSINIRHTKKGREVARAQRQARKGHEKNRKKKEAMKRASERQIAECRVNLDKMESLALVVVRESHKENFDWKIREVEELFNIFGLLLTASDTQRAVYKNLFQTGRYAASKKGIGMILKDAPDWLPKKNYMEKRILKLIGSFDVDPTVTREAATTTMSSARTFFDYTQLFFAERTILGFVLGLLDPNRIERYIKSKGYKTFLDLGSGETPSISDSFLDRIRADIPQSETTYCDPVFASTVGGHTTGSRFTAEQLQEFVLDKGPRAKFIPDRIQDLSSVADESIDMITSAWVFDKFNEQNLSTQQAFREVARVLRVGGEARLAPVNWTRENLEFLNQMADIFEIESVVSLDENGYDWNNKTPTVSLVLRKRQISSERMEKIRSDSKKWIETYLSK